MSQRLATAQGPIADSGPGAPGAPLFFDPLQTIISQYANSPVILALVQRLGEAIDKQAALNAWYDSVWNVLTAVSYGLDVWGRIVGVNRVLQVSAGEYLGWDEAGDAQTFGHGVWGGRGTLTSNYALTDDAYRTLILAKAALNITDGSIPAINATLLAVFGQGYVEDGEDMTMTYVFATPLSPVEQAIVSQSGVLPKPAGVSVSSRVVGT